MSNFFSFIASLGKVSSKGAARGLIEKIVQTFPEAASEAQLDVLTGDFDELSKMTARYEAIKNEAEAREIKAKENYNKTLAQAQTLEARMGKTPTADEQEALAILNERLDALEADALEAKEDAALAREDYEQVYGGCVELSNLIKKARREIENARKDMERSERKVERANARASRSEELAGLRKPEMNFSTVAVDAMNKKTKENEQTVQAANLRSNLLGNNGVNASGVDKVLASLEEPIAKKVVCSARDRKPME